MGRNSSAQLQSELMGIENELPVEYNYDELRRVQLQSQFPAQIIVIGQVSGERYVWSKAGDILEVDSRDLDELLLKGIGRGACCGNTFTGNLLFRLVED